MSQAAADWAGADAGPNATFFAADAEAFQPDGSFDFIVFNEVVYYFRQPLAEVHRYARSLTATGSLVFSTWQGLPRGCAILRQLHEVYDVSGETLVEQGRNRWKLTVLAPRAER